VTGRLSGRRGIGMSAPTSSPIACTSTARTVWRRIDQRSTSNISRCECTAPT
jgi:hypothetical protein